MSVIEMNLFEDYPMQEVSENIIGGTILNALPSTSITSNKTLQTKKAKKQATVKIEDFGEKIGGARKDIFAMYRSMLKVSYNNEIKDKSFSQIWPVPNYEKLLESGIEKDKVDLIRALRETVPRKPRRSYYLDNYCKMVTALQSVAIDAIDGNIDIFDENKKLDLTKLDGILSTKLVKPNDRINFIGKYLLYNINGHSHNFKDIVLRHFTNGDYGLTNGHRIVSDGPTIKEVIMNYSSEYLAKINIDEVKSKKSEKDNANVYKIYMTRNPDTSERCYEIGRKIGKRVFYYPQKYSYTKEFYLNQKAFIRKHIEELDDYFDSIRNIPNERENYNEERTGILIRTKDVTPEEFLTTFGFRGVEFGNYVERNRRQEDLNQAYDALMDLSKVLNIPTQAISLGGKLGLAFGARGRGGKNAALAHYEPNFEVINLTKNKGAGSLAHEWFHALDHSLANYHKMESDYATKIILNKDNQNIMSVLNKDLADNFSEYVDQFKNKINLRKRSQELDDIRSNSYWTTEEEMGARTFEALVKRKLENIGIRNDYLVNIRSQTDWENSAKMDDSYPYPTEEELDILEPYFDKVVSSLREEENEGKITLYSARGNGKELEEGIKQIYYEELTEKEKALQAFSEQLFGVQTVFIEGDEKLHGKFDRDTNVMYLNRNSEISLLWTAMHESFHILKNVDADLHKKLMEFADNNNICSKELIENYRKERNDPTLSDEVIKEELLADAFADLKTGRRLIKDFSKEQPVETSKLCRFFKNIVSKGKKFFFGNEKVECEKKYPEVKLPEEKFKLFANHIEELHNEHLKTQNLTKGTEILTMALNDVSKEGYFKSPYCYNPRKQAEFDLKFIQQVAPIANKKVIVDVIDMVSPLGKKGYTDVLLQQSGSLENKKVFTR